ncbi:mannitol dehydrogenase family protein [uncultured Roseobacter sp.]|uniref:mannitol dehydrogenase family protein n=1 Tax=uncultured Roseobacter sp. TaxID=114847 RepID=UPI00260A35D5|nr:mannitol dehydrogenase family protein [uncultured Roseobacter sp.]
MGRILHIGVGNFARAHLAEYTADAGGWRITGVSLRSAAVRDGLRAAGHKYALAVQGRGVRRIGVFDEVLVAPEDPGAVLARIADPEVAVITLTVTEKGYHLGGDGRLDLDDAAIVADLAGGAPRTVIGYLARGLAARRAPVTVLSCDNLAGNGARLGAAVAAFGEAAGLPPLGGFIGFPSAMVDRITPATTDALRAETGCPMAVATEPFREWVIEDAFAGPRPDWPGVQIVPDVAPYEMRKLRMLNGAHSLLAYAGTLAGHAHVHEAVGDADLRGRVDALMTQTAQTLPAEMQDAAAGYARALMQRFENPHLAHKLRQIAMDGSQKLPHRIVAPLRELVASGKDASALHAALEAWLGFCRAEVAAEQPLEDPRHEEITRLITAGAPDSALLGVIGAADLARD